MGWLYTHKDPKESVLDFFQKRFNYTRENGSYGKIIACSVKNIRTAYMAYEIYRADENKKDVVALVCLLDYVPNDYYNFGYKDMDETMGPYEDECPEKILKLLTPTDYEYANDWRNRCWENIRKNKARLNLKPGMKIRAPRPIYFSVGTFTDFEVVSPKEKLFKIINSNNEDGRLVRIKGKINWLPLNEPEEQMPLKQHPQPGLF